MGGIEVFEFEGNMKLVYKVALYFPIDITALNEMADDLEKIAQWNGFVLKSTVQVNYGVKPRRDGLITLYVDVEYNENHPFRTTTSLLG